MSCQQHKDVLDPAMCGRQQGRLAVSLSYETGGQPGAGRAHNMSLLFHIWCLNQHSMTTTSLQAPKPPWMQHPQAHHVTAPTG